MHLADHTGTRIVRADQHLRCAARREPAIGARAQPVRDAQVVEQPGQVLIDVVEAGRPVRDNDDGPVIPQATVDKPPSAELRPDQLDSDSLPPYDVLDAILRRYVEDSEGPEQIAAAGFEPELVARILQMVARSEHKRRQAATVIKLSPRAFGPGRRFPIARY